MTAFTLHGKRVAAKARREVPPILRAAPIALEGAPGAG